MMNARGHLSSETIDLLLLSALEAQEANAAKSHLDGCTTCKQRWVELNEDKVKFEQFVFARTLPKLEERLKKKSLFERLDLRLLVPALGLGAAALVAVIATGGGDGGPTGQTEDEVYIGIKGKEPLFEVFALRGSSAQFEVKAGTPLKPKDRIRFVVNPAGAKYVLVASRDGKGTFTVYHPYGAAESAPVDAKPPRRLELPNAVELDETAGAERLVAVFSDKPVKAAEVQAALEKNPQAPALPDAKVISLEFVKEKP